MKNIEQYGLLKDDEWKYLAWIPNPRPPFRIWVMKEEIGHSLLYNIILMPCRFY